MANPMFTPETSTNQIYRNQDDTRCLTDDLDAIEADIEDLQNGKADTAHTHTGYAPTAHAHTEYAPTSHTHTEYAAVGHAHDYAPTAHTHTASDVGAAASAHTHAQGEVTGLATALAGKANATHTHAQADVTGLVTALAAKADLVDGKVPESQLPSYVSDIVEAASTSAFPATGVADRIYVAKDTNKTYRWSGTGYVEISASIALGETSATAHRGDHGKVAYDHSQNGDVHVTAAQKAAWNAKQNALSFDTTPTANSTNPVTSGGVKSALDGKAEASHIHSYNDLTDKPTIPTVPASLPANGGNADTVDGKHASDFAAAEHNHLGYSGQSASTYKMVYVATNGSDNNSGASTSAPMATVKGAVRKYADKYKMLDIRLADGIYNEDLGVIAVDQCNLSIRSLSSDKNAVTINSATALDLSVPETRLYNLTINITAPNIRAICVNAGILYAYGIRLNVPVGSTASCVNVYNGTFAFLMDCVFNSGTASNSGASVYGNQASQIKAINCTSERTNKIGFHAHNGSDIIYTDTITATTKTKETFYGKCTLRS